MLRKNFQGIILFLIFINDLTMFLNEVYFLLYADDLKLYRTINDFSDCVALQDDVNFLCCWCKLNGMVLNVSKCNVISFTRRKNPLLNSYVIDANVIPRVEVVKDLGVYLDVSLHFKQHVNVTTSKANSVLGLIRRFGREFNDVYVTKSLFCYLVLPILE